MLVTMDSEERDYEERVRLEADFVREISEMPIAVHQQEANDQHYEIPAEFYRVNQKSGSRYIGLNCG